MQIIGLQTIESLIIQILAHTLRKEKHRDASR